MSQLKRTDNLALENTTGTMYCDEESRAEHEACSAKHKSVCLWQRIARQGWNEQIPAQTHLSKSASSARLFWCGTFSSSRLLSS